MIHMPPWSGKYFWVNFDSSETRWPYYILNNNFKSMLSTFSKCTLIHIVWFSLFWLILFRKYVFMRRIALKARSLVSLLAAITRQHCASFTTWSRSNIQNSCRMYVCSASVACMYVCETFLWLSSNWKILSQ